MCQQSLRTIRKRPGFTLIELLVAMTIMIFLATLAVLILPRMNEQQRASKGADQLQGWLLIAKQRALRSGSPSGLRFVDDPNNPTKFMTEVLYIEQPPDFAIQPGISSQSTQTRQILIKFVTALPATPPLVPNPVTPLPVLVAQIEQPSTAPGVQDFTGGINTTAPTDDPAWPVQPGDYLEVQGGGLMRQIVHVHPSYLELATPLVSPQPLSSGNVVDLTPTYRIIRGSRVLQGEEPLKLPNNVGIFKGIAVAYTNPTLPNQTVSLIQVPGTMVGTLQGNGSNALEILFAPSGRVLSPNVDPIYLWVADESADDPTRQNQPVILSIKAATGFIANYPVDETYAPAILPPLPWPPTPYTPANNPYIFAQSNRSGGL